MLMALLEAAPRGHFPPSHCVACMGLRSNCKHAPLLQGMAAIQDKLNLPIVMHNRQVRERSHCLSLHSRYHSAND